MNIDFEKMLAAGTGKAPANRCENGQNEVFRFHKALLWRKLIRVNKSQKILHALEILIHFKAWEMVWVDPI